MAFRSLIAEPAELQKLANAFDAAWISVNAIRPIDPLQVSAERERLGGLLVHLWQSDPDADLVKLAVGQFIDGVGSAKSRALERATPEGMRSLEIGPHD